MRNLLCKRVEGICFAYIQVQYDRGCFLLSSGLGVVTGESLRAVLKPTDLLQMRRVEEI